MRFEKKLPITWPCGWQCFVMDVVAFPMFIYGVWFGLIKKVVQRRYEES